jgi:hypothetical protein
MVLLQ